MFEYGLKSKKSDLYDIGIKSATVHWNYEPAQLYEEALRNGEGVIADSGAGEVCLFVCHSVVS